MMSSNVKPDLGHLLRVFEKVMITRPELRGVSGNVLTGLVRMGPHQLAHFYSLTQEWDNHSKRKFYKHEIISGSGEGVSFVKPRVEKRTKQITADDGSAIRPL